VLMRAPDPDRVLARHLAAALASAPHLVTDVVAAPGEPDAVSRLAAVLLDAPLPPLDIHARLSERYPAIADQVAARGPDLARDYVATLRGLAATDNRYRQPLAYALRRYAAAASAGQGADDEAAGEALREAVAILRVTDRRGPALTDALDELAEHLLATGHYRDAFAAAREAVQDRIARDASYTAALARAAAAALEAGEPEQAASFAQDALARSAGPAVLVTLGAALQALGSPEAARGAFEDAVTRARAAGGRELIAALVHRDRPGDLDEAATLVRSGTQRRLVRELAAAPDDPQVRERVQRALRLAARATGPTTTA